VVILFREIGITEIIIVAIVLIILFGGNKLRELAKNLSNSVREFRKAFKNGKQKEN